jgi:hypothetical protein
MTPGAAPLAGAWATGLSAAGFSFSGSTWGQPVAAMVEMASNAATSQAG